MRLLLNIFAFVAFVVSLGAAPMAHALELPDISISAQVPIGEQVSAGHAPGDSDQVPADSDKSYPHHHGGCHSDHLAEPVKLPASSWMPKLPKSLAYHVASILPGSAADPALRPPQA